MEKSFTGIERRYYVRLDTILPVRFKLETDPSHKAYVASTKNISHGGMCVEVGQDIDELLGKLNQIKTSLTIFLELRDPQEEVELNAQPRWVQSFLDWVKKPSKKEKNLLVGLAFEKLEGPTKDIIHNYIVNQFVKNYGTDKF